MSKTYYVELKETNGEYTYNIPILVTAIYDIELRLDDILLDWYGDEAYDEYSYDEADRYYYYNCGEVAIKVSLYKEITEQEYKVLSKFITEL